ncbi:MAG: DNA-processing protein DprA [bacterium]|nr:DNA-processing protein DprA [bacterium]
MIDFENIYLGALTQITGLSNKKIIKLKSNHPSFQEIWRRGPNNWEISPQYIKQATNQYNTFSIDKYQESLLKKEIKIINYEDSMYSQLLKQTIDFPVMLYYQGDISLLNSVCLGVVGTRDATQYGARVIEKFIPKLSNTGITIVSGFQRGIDTLAHKSAMSSNGKTIAVLGTGLDVPYPSQNQVLFKKLIIDNLAISEYPPQTQPLAFNFPKRNRIITGLSLGVLVVEAAKKSGSLVSAKFALEQDREVFAVPNSIFALGGEGTNYLIDQGAKTTTSPSDILTTLNITHNLPEAKSVTQTFNQVQTMIIDALKLGQINIDELIKKTKCSSGDVMSEVTILTLQGDILEVGDNIYCLSTPT